MFQEAPLPWQVPGDIGHILGRQILLAPLLGLGPVVVSRLLRPSAARETSPFRQASSIAVPLTSFVNGPAIGRLGQAGG